AIVLNALATPHPHVLPGGQAAQPELDDCGLANPHLATNEAQLALAAGRALEPALQALGFVLAAHEGAWRQQGCALQVTPAEKAIPLLAHRRDILRRRRRVAQGRPNLPH